MLYVAVRVSHPEIAYVRVALPLTDIRHQLRTDRHGDARGARHRARRRRRPGVRAVEADRPPRHGDRRRRGPLPRRRSDAAPPRLRRRRAGRGGARARRFGAGSRTAARGAGARPVAHGGHPRRHVRRGHRRSIRGGRRAARQSTPRGNCCGSTTWRSAATMSRPSGIRRSPIWSAPRWRDRRSTSCSCRRRATSRGR